MGKPQDTTNPNSQAECQAQTLSTVRHGLRAMIELAERMLGTVGAQQAIDNAHQALIEEASKPLHEQPPGVQADVMNRCDWSLQQLRRIIDANVGKLTPRQVLHGIIDAVADSGIDLSRCYSEADVKRVILDILLKNSPATGTPSGDEGGEA